MSEQKSGQGLIWLLVILAVVNVGLSYMTFTMAGGSLSLLGAQIKAEQKAAGKTDAAKPAEGAKAEEHKAAEPAKH